MPSTTTAPVERKLSRFTLLRTILPLPMYRKDPEAIKEIENSSDPRLNRLGQRADRFGDPVYARRPSARH
jgi:hypothetical protein